MRISDWSSDVCSSDLQGEGLAQLMNRVFQRVDAHLQGRLPCRERHLRSVRAARGDPARAIEILNAHLLVVASGRRRAGVARLQLDHEIVRASCRERVCQYVYLSVFAVSLKKKT